MHDPRESDMLALKCILHYLHVTIVQSLFIRPSHVDILLSYSDSDYSTTCWFTFGFCVYLGDNLVSWSSKRPHIISRSSAKAECRGVANVVAEVG
uniref:Uncharacterized protein n=1 Tax=Lactuca sativa TaxID=4236 RepID=A0A9R1WUA9_LACSA|nr:hypothetical protein LSAT_V11C800392410 [Lactuca sativa]